MLRYLDFSAGAESISLGLKAAGFLCVGVKRMDDRAAASYRFNFPDRTDETALLCPGAAEGDGRLLKPHQVTLHPRVPTSAANELDLSLAGSPRQDLSHMQTRAFGDEEPTTQEQT